MFFVVATTTKHFTAENAEHAEKKGIKLVLIRFFLGDGCKKSQRSPRSRR
jgi:hypothetical protein